MAGAANARLIAEQSGRTPWRANSDLGDRRRWTSFLTWAFVLAEMAARDGLLPTSAHSGDEALDHADHASGDTAPIANNLPNISVSTAAEAPEPITYQHAPTMPAYAPTPLSSELGEAKTVPFADALAHNEGGAGGGSGSAGELRADHASLASATSEQLFVAFNPAGEALDLGMTLDLSDTLQNLLGRVSDGLDGLPLVGGLLDGVVDTLATTTGDLLSTLTPATSLRGVEDGHDDAAGAGIGSPGHISSASGAPSDSPALMNESGGYTNYGISLNIGSSDSGSASDAAVDGALAASGLDSTAFDHLPGVDHSSSDALHLDQTVLRTASDILA